MSGQYSTNDIDFTRYEKVRTQFVNDNNGTLWVEGNNQRSLYREDICDRSTEERHFN